MVDAQIEPGTVTTRAEMKQVFGGGQGQGIHPSGTTPNVLIYTDPEAGEQSGYFDGWLAEEDEHGPIFEYTGHGEGHQTFDGLTGTGNKAILRHVDDGRMLRVFKAVGVVPGSAAKQQRYIGSFELDAEQPYVIRQTRNKAGDWRRVIVFRLRPTRELPRVDDDIVPVAEETSVLPVLAIGSAQESGTPEIDASRVRSHASRTTSGSRAVRLSEEFQDFLRAQSHEVRRFQVKIKGQSSTLLTDLYDVTAHVLFQVKGTCSRKDVQTAIGQLLDYRRYVDPRNPTLAVLLPEKPSDDLTELLGSININMIYEDDGIFIGWPVMREVRLMH